MQAFTCSCGPNGTDREGSSGSASIWGVCPCSNAGTVEFIVDKHGKHYYMETNPR